MKNFVYHKPTTVDEAARLLVASDAKLLAGGMTLLPTMKQQLATPDALVDLAALEDLTGIRLHEQKGIIIGAMTTHAAVAVSELVVDKLPALARLAGNIGDVQVRHRGTAGGSLANNDPAADYPAALLALDGEVHTNKRTITAGDYFDGLFATALAEDEIIRHLHFPIPKRAAYIKFAQPASLYALVGVFVAETDAGARVAITGAGANGVFRATGLEEKLNQNFSADALSDAVFPPDDLLEDLHGSAKYRASLIVTLAKRAVASC